MTVPKITVVFDPPLVSDTPAVFDAKSFDTVGKLNPFAQQANALADGVDLAVTTVDPVVSNLSVILASPANATIAQQNAASSNTYRQQAAASATAAAGSATAAQAAAATAQAIVWQGTTGYPKIRPSLLLDFANSKTVDPRITFTRASTASYWDDKGILRQALAGQPRIDHDPVTGECKGLLIEESRTNLPFYSEQFGNAAWNKLGASITANAITAPDGTLTADKFIEDTSNGGHTLRVGSYGIKNNVARSLSFFLKAGERTFAEIVINSFLNNYFRLIVNLVTGEFNSAAFGNAVINSASVDYVGDGWWRCALSGIPNTTEDISSCDHVMRSLPSYAGGSIYQGDGTSGIYVWGAQLEAGSFPTSYIPTPATFTSRASEGTYFDSTGLLKTAAINEPRYDHGLVDGVWVPKGLLLEPQRTNLLTYSDNFDNAVWVKSNATVSANATTAPDGTLTFDKLVEDTSSNLHFINQSASVATSSVSTFSFYAKAAERSTILVHFADPANPTNRAEARFNLSNGTFSNLVNVGATKEAKAFIQNEGNGIYRCSISAIINSGTSATGRCFLIDSLGNETYTGDGTSGIYLWRAQLEEIPAGQSPEPSSPIKTEATAVTRSADVSTSSAVTRAADAATLPIGDWHNRYAGTWLVKAAVRSGEPVITAGDITITADTDAEKTYALAYDTAKNAANVQLGKGTFKQVTYYPKKLLTNEIAALQA